MSRARNSPPHQRALHFRSHIVRKHTNTPFCSVCAAQYPAAVVHTQMAKWYIFLRATVRRRSILEIERCTSFCLSFRSCSVIRNQQNTSPQEQDPQIQASSPLATIINIQRLQDSTIQTTQKFKTGEATERREKHAPKTEWRKIRTQPVTVVCSPQEREKRKEKQASSAPQNAAHPTRKRREREKPRILVVSICKGVFSFSFVLICRTELDRGRISPGWMPKCTCFAGKSDWSSRAICSPCPYLSAQSVFTFSIGGT